jgi:hypothetical protein
MEEQFKAEALSSLTAARQNLQASLVDANRKSEGHDARKLERKRSVEAKPTPPKPRREPPSRPPALSTQTSTGEAPTSSSHQDQKSVRDLSRKGIREALKGRVEKCDDVTIEDDKLQDLANEIEEALFRYYNKDVGPKYKAKYRSLCFNIKDEKNTGLFRKIVSGKISPRSLVALSPEEMASKELQQWRQAELKHDIEKIKSHELDMIQHGSKIIVKSHKGEEVIEAKLVGAGPPAEVKLPEEIEPVNKVAKDGAAWSSKSWEVGKLKLDILILILNVSRMISARQEAQLRPVV